MDKVFPGAEAALFDVKDGASIMSGGFGLCGNPENLIRALRAKGVKNLTLISNNCGTEHQGLGVLIAAGQVRKLICSYLGYNKDAERRLLAGELEVELVPQGTLAERIRCGRAGIPAFYTPTAVGTLLAEGKEIRVFEGREYLLERALKADFAFIKAWKGDRYGNLVYRKSARNFNPVMATAANVTIAEVEELVEPGDIDPDQVHTPGIYVDRIVKGEFYEKWIEKRTVRPRPS